MMRPALADMIAEFNDEPTMSDRIRSVVQRTRDAGVAVHARNILDLVLDNVPELHNSAEAREAIRAAGFR